MRQAGRSILAVLAGYLASVCSFVVTGYVLYRLLDRETFEWHHPPYYSLTSLSGELLRLIISVAVGGYVASAIARYARAWHAGVVAACILIPMSAQGFPDPYSRPAWYWVLSLAAIIPSGLLGSWAASRNRRVAV